MSKKPRLYWVWMDGKAGGPHEPGDLAALPGFGPEIRVAPAGAAKSGDWRRAHEVPEVAEVLAKKKDRPRARSMEDPAPATTPTRPAAHPERGDPPSDIPVAKCPECGAKNEPEAWFCSGCRQPLVLRACPHCGIRASGDAVICPKCTKPLSAVPRLPAAARLADLDLPGDEVVKKAVLERLARGWFFRPETRTGVKILDVAMACVLDTTIHILEERLQIRPVRGRAQGYAGEVGNVNEVAPPTRWEEAWHSYHLRLPGVPESHTCSNCGGRGWTPCKQMEPCYCMPGRDRFNCPWCRGTGWRECSICRGSGRADCGCEGGLVHTHFRLDVGRRPKALRQCWIPRTWSAEISEKQMKSAEGITAFVGGGNPQELLSLQWRRLPHDEIYGTEDESKCHADGLIDKLSCYLKELTGDGRATPDLVSIIKDRKTVRFPRSSRLTVRLIPVWKVEYEFAGRKDHFVVLGTGLAVRRALRWRLLDLRRVSAVCAVAAMVLANIVALVSARLIEDRVSAVGPNPLLAAIHARPLNGMTEGKDAFDKRIRLVKRDLVRARRFGDEEAERELSSHLRGLKRTYEDRWGGKKAPRPLRRTARNRARKPSRRGTRSKPRVRAKNTQARRTAAAGEIRDLMAAKRRAADAGDIAGLKEAEAGYKGAVDAYIKDFGEQAWQQLRRSLANEGDGTADTVTGGIHPRSKGSSPRRSGPNKDATKMSVDELEQYLRGLGNGSK